MTLEYGQELFPNFKSSTFGIQINLKKTAQFHSNMVIVLTVCIDSAWTQECISVGLVKP